ncbi:response regulator [Paenibacillus sp. TRM 82003]|nr:response regulator [Paenibacillus sp. TRM 82003]
MTDQQETVHLLLVDDLPHNLLALRAVLDDPSYRLVCVPSGKEALLAALRQQFAVIILDVQMPEMDGFETARYLTKLKKNKHTPIIFLTASERERHLLSEGYSAGGFDYITKPFDVTELRQKVKRLAEFHREQSRLTREVERLRKRTAIAERRQFAGEMAVGIAHELRNPMTTIRGFLQLAQRTGTELGPAKIELMLEELSQTDSFISDFIHLASNKRVQKRHIDFNTIIEDALPAIREKAAEAEADVRFLPETVPPLLADPEEMLLLLTLLTDNGVESMDGGVLTIATLTHERETVVMVRDEGAGIPTEHLDKLGMPFYTTKEERRGLGLAVVFSIVERHGGRIQLCSDASGTVVCVYFPVEAQDL